MGLTLRNSELHCAHRKRFRMPLFQVDILELLTGFLQKISRVKAQGCQTPEFPVEMMGQDRLQPDGASCPKPADKNRDTVDGMTQCILYYHNS